jgi:precorrin-6B methylase 2
VIGSLTALVRHARKDGLGAMVRVVRNRLSERWHERRLGIRTHGSVDLQTIGHSRSACHDYQPITYRSFAAVMGRLEIRPGTDVFVDFGAGKGRVVVLAALRPFRRVVGIEFAEDFAREARANLDRVSAKLRCPDVEIVLDDAAHFRLPDDATILHFFNPFHGEVLDAVMDEIERSVAAAPRRVTILFANPEHFESHLRTRGWNLTREDVQWPDAARVDPHANRYRIYQLAAPLRRA